MIADIQVMPETARALFKLAYSAALALGKSSPVAEADAFAKVQVSFCKECGWKLRSTPDFSKFDPSQERDEHGRFSAGSSGALQTAAQSAIGEHKGFTFNPVMVKAPTSGLAVGGYGKRGIYDVDSFGKADIEGFIKQNENTLKDSSAYLGGWIDGGKVYLDVSHVFPDDQREAAIEAGKQHNEISIANLSAIAAGKLDNAFISTGGTGKMAKGKVMFLLDHRQMSSEEMATAIKEMASQHAKYSEDQPRDEHGRFGSGGSAKLVDGKFVAAPASLSADGYPKAGGVVDGLTVRDDIPNMSSIGASLNDPVELSGIREVPMSYLIKTPGKPSDRIQNLAEQIKASAEINPLIVAIDEKGPYILEGSHRFDALGVLGKKSFPALVVYDADDIPTFEKYSDSQARDDHGRFTSEGTSAENGGRESGSRSSARSKQRGELGSESGGASGSESVSAAQAAADKAAGGEKPIDGLPVKPVQFSDGSYYVPGPSAAAREVARDYMEKAGLEYKPISTYEKVDPERATKIAQAFEDMKHAPNDPAVAESYKALISETLSQWQAMKDAGVKIDFIKPGTTDPYAESPRLAMQDLRDNNHMWVFPTVSGFGDHDEASDNALYGNPLLAKTGEVIGGHELRANDVFRAVHDYFGHFKEGNGFRAAGEENAWRSHSRIYSDKALPAMTSETRGQNSWVNFGPHGDTNRTASTAETHYAPQKIGLMPAWTYQIGKYSDSQPRDEHGRFSSTGAAPNEGGYIASAETSPKAHEEGMRRSRLAVKRIAKDYNYNPDLVDVTDVPETFTLNGEERSYAGGASPDGHITIWPDQIPPDRYEAVLAHEVMHERYNYFMAEYEKERDAAADASSKVNWNRTGPMMPSGSIRPEFADKYPLTAAVDEGGHNLLDTTKLAEGDGVTGYSTDWWKSANDGYSASTSAVNETLAEIAALGGGDTPPIPKLPDGYDYKPSMSGQSMDTARQDGWHVIKPAEDGSRFSVGWGRTKYDAAKQAHFSSRGDGKPPPLLLPDLARYVPNPFGPTKSTDNFKDTRWQMLYELINNTWDKGHPKS